MRRLHRKKKPVSRKGAASYPALCPFRCAGGCGQRQGSARKRRACNAPDGKYNEDHDLHSCAGKGNPKDLVTASANAAAQPKVHLGMHEGEAFYLGIFYIP